MAEGETPKLPVVFEEKENYYLFKVADKVIVMAKAHVFLRESVQLEVPTDQAYEVIIVGLQEGFWNVKNTAKK